MAMLDPCNKLVPIFSQIILGVLEFVELKHAEIIIPTTGCFVTTPNNRLEDLIS